MSYENEYDLQRFSLLTYRETSYVWYGVGQWDGHIMDWRGSNFFHGRLPQSPTFKQPSEALAWLEKALDEGEYHRGMSLSGHHSGESRCSKGCDDREVVTIFFGIEPLKKGEAVRRNSLTKLGDIAYAEFASGVMGRLKVSEIRAGKLDDKGDE